MLREVVRSALLLSDKLVRGICRSIAPPVSFATS